MLISLEDLLKSNLVLIANPKLQREERKSTFSVKPLDAKAITAEARAKVAQYTKNNFPFGSREKYIEFMQQLYGNLKVWEFSTGGLDEVKSLKAFIRPEPISQLPKQHSHAGHDHGEGTVATVCSRIAWGPVKVTIKPQGKAIELPLTSEYLLYSYFLPEGTVPSSDVGLWQLPMNVDQSFLRVFAYEFTVMGGIKPVAKADVTSLRFPVDLPFLFTQSTSTQPQKDTGPLRIIVCQSLACGKVRNDFEPFGVLGAARVIPHFMIIATQDVHQITAKVTVERPKTSPMTKMGNDEMNPEIQSIFFTDRNNPNTFPLQAPYWDQIFDYYCANPPVGEILKIVDASRGLRYGTVESFAENLLNWSYSSRSVTKVARQGAFDSLHMAPSMRMPQKVIDACPPEWKSALTNVSMAPFCVHDCLHTHWRWMNVESYGKHIKGWGGTKEFPGGPFEEAGAPLVPPNQDVTLKLKTQYGFEYEATVQKPRAGRWQVVMHHGSAYAISTNGIASAGGIALDQALMSDTLPGQSGREGEWAIFYWNLRYDTDVPWQMPWQKEKPKPTYRERIKLSDAKVRHLRDL